ncbi:MAG TPA: hypothetical protein VJP59_02010 [Gemmatimonadota bacterium]|nr:hypothetical protein [Gemmatimonadota bacterium]
MADERSTTSGPEPQPEPSVEEELRNLGRRFADVLQAAWTSEERHKVEAEVREGMRRFSEELERVFERTRESPTAERVRTKLGSARGRAAESEAGRRTREAVAQGLHRLSDELARLAERFTPREADPEVADGHRPDDPAE